MMDKKADYQSRNAGDRFKSFPMSLNIPLDIVGGTAFGKYPKISNEQTINMIISDECLVDFAGHTLVATIGATRSRAVYNYVMFKSVIEVADDGVYIIDYKYNSTRVGTLSTQNGNVFMAANQAGQVGIVDGLYVYIYDFNKDSFQRITVAFSPVYITFQDTFFIAIDGNSNQWFLSDNNNGMVWPTDAQHVGELQTKANLGVAVIALDRILLVMGQIVTEPWYDAGLQLFPYQRNNYYCIDYGILSAQTLASGFGMIVWLAVNEYSGLSIQVSEEGNVPNSISNDGMDYFFSQLKKPQDSFAMLYKLDGHIIYHITFVADNRTFIYDFNTKMFFSLSDENGNYHPARKVIFFNNSNHFISLKDGNLYKMASYINTYNGNTIPRIRIGKNIRFPGADRFIVQNINITMESGINQTISKIDFAASTDGGYSYNNYTPTILNSWGQRQNAMNLYNLGGIENDFVPRYQFWGTGRFVITGGTMSLYR